MPIYARFLPMASRAHRVALLCLEPVVAFDLSVPSEVFSLAWSDHRPLYELEACAARPGSVATTTGFAIGGVAGLEAVARADTVLVPGYTEVLDPPPDAVLDALRAAAARGARVASICTGAFALAYAGLLDGRRATTHWFAADELARRFRAVDVEPNSLYVEDGRVLTSAGLSAGIDLCLHIVRSDHGERIGSRVARAMVAAPHRDGGQAQFIERALPETRATIRSSRCGAGRSTTSTSRWTSRRSLAALAVSPRTFARRFVAETGTTPLRWLQRPARARGAPAARAHRPRRRAGRGAIGVRLGTVAARALPPRDATTPTA